MKVNEEIDALTTMALDPLRFSGGAAPAGHDVRDAAVDDLRRDRRIDRWRLVMLSFDIPLVTYFKQITGVVSIGDFTGGFSSRPCSRIWLP